MNIDIWQLPTHTIYLAQLNDAKDIFKLLKGVRYYCYSFTHISGILKFGQSANDQWQKGQWGERIYRQALHIPGWSTKPSPKTSGKEIRDLFKYYPKINRNDITVKVWDMTGYNFLQKDNPKFELTTLENQLVEAYETMTGVKPVGNIKSLTYIKNRSVVSDQTWNKLVIEE